jgi:putative proteasome-type protease
LIYPEGNFIEASEDQPFFQIGETKYGKPILVRALEQDATFGDSIKLLLVSFDSTMKANVSVGMPIDICTIKKDQYQVNKQIRIEKNDPYFQKISNGWGESLKKSIKN